MNVVGRHIVRTEDDRTDRIGVRTLILSRRWQASTDELSRDQLDAEAPPTPAAPKRMELIGSQRRPDGGGLREYWTYAGLDPREDRVKRYGKSNDFDFQRSWEQLSLLQHRKITKLLSDYSGSVLDGQIVWPPTVGGGQDRRTIGIGDAGTNDAGETNPMFGHQTFFNFSGAYSYRYVADNLNGLTQNVRLVKAGNLPGAAPSFGDRDYLIGPEDYQHFAGHFIVELLALLSPIGGWNKPIYRGTIA